MESSQMKKKNTLAAAKKRAAEASAEFAAAVAEVEEHPGRRSRERASRATVAYGIATAKLEAAEIAAGVRPAPPPPVYSREIVARIKLTAAGARRLSAVVRKENPRSGLAGFLSDAIEGIVTTNEGLRPEPFWPDFNVDAELHSLRG